jgi:phospholipid transport system substrate-binding protein
MSIRFATFLCFFTLFIEIAHGASSPRETVEALHAELLGVMREADQLGVEGRYEHLNTPMRELFDFERMTSVVVGRKWRDASAEEREQIVEAFADFSIATYASRFNGYSGERFETLGEKAGPRDSVFVSTQIIQSNGEPVELTYMTLEKGQSWHIADVFLRGTISETARLRSEFRAILNEGGTEQLTEKLVERTNSLLSGTAESP